MRITPDQIITAQSMTGDVTSSAQQLDQMFGYGIQAVWSGTPNGTIKLQGSINYNPVTNVGDWDDIANSSQTISGSAGSFLWSVSDVMYRYVRVVYTHSSSTGTLNASFFGRGF